MTKKLLVTDSYFVTGQHISELQDAGYEVTHLDVPSATEQQLVDAIKGVSVYILGGIEQVTDKVIEAADALEAIIFCGVDYDKFIPAADQAKQKGIAIYNAPGANATAVAEFALGVALLMQRQLLSVSRGGDKKYFTAASLQGVTIGVIGAGNIGVKIIEMVQPFGPHEIIYYNRSPKDVPGRQVSLSELVETANVIFLALPMKSGQVLTSDLIARLKRGSLLVSISPINLIDTDALLPRLQSGDIRAAIDWPSPSAEFDELPLESWYSVGSHSAYNTAIAGKLVGDAVAQKARELL
jgi:phosphoglycerate dehydrogenase-like enzyme